MDPLLLLLLFWLGLSCHWPCGDQLSKLGLRTDSRPYEYLSSSHLPKS